MRREGAPANRATRLEGLEHSPPLHATRLSFERPLRTSNITAGQARKLLSILFQLPARARACSLPETHLLH